MAPTDCSPPRSRRPATFAAISALVASIAVASPSRAADPAPPTAGSAALHSITFARLVLRIPGTSEIAVSGDEIRVRLLEMLRSKGFPALGAESLIFDKDLSNKARFVLGGTVSELECQSAWGYERRCRMGIQWELLDNESGRVVYRTTTRSVAVAGQPKPTGDDLILKALGSLITRLRFVDVMRKSNDKTPAPSSFAKASFKRCSAPTASMPGGADKISEATVLIESGNSLGSGVLISPDGFVLTAAHVIASREATKVQVPGGSQALGAVVRSDKLTDIALLKVQSFGATPCLQHRADPMKVADEVFAIGSPLGKQLSFSFTRGIVSGMREIDGVSLLQTDASVNRGNSGGPMIDSQGRWTAIITWKAAGGGVEGIGFGVPTQTVFKALAIEPGDNSDASLQQAEVVKVEQATVIDDPPDQMPVLFPPGTQSGGGPSIAPPRSPISPAGEKVATAGWWGIGLGTAGVLTTWFVHGLNGAGSHLDSTPSYPKDSFERLRTYNTISWIVVGGGVVAVIASKSMREKPTAPPAVSFTGGIGPGSVSFQLRY